MTSRKLTWLLGLSALAYGGCDLTGSDDDLYSQDAGGFIEMDGVSHNSGDGGEWGREDRGFRCCVDI